ncbi:MAG TPA: right-handed parallel beta-helix repeat-containing protein [Chthoniobacterales bacterium]|jgi:hypothetical protein|nr:right-handed parallel beta-helix repeat-containing protein [Chthoniobacterales bacterium]
MNNSRTLLSLLAAGVGLAFSTTGFAQATRTWVSGVGDDVNPCSRTAPCKTFAGAISKTAAGGEISALDPGGFGTITITKSITINGTGTLAGILAAGTNGVNVNDSASGTPNASVVILRDISINGAGTGFDGVRYISGKSLMVDHCWIYGFNGNGASSDGIDVAKTGDGNLKVVNGTTIENITGDGIHLNTSAGIVVAVIDNTTIMNCGGDGLEAAANIRGEFSRSNVSIVTGNGISSTGGNVQMNIDDMMVSHANGTGVRSSGGSSIRVSDSIIANNSTGLSLNGGTIDSFQGNSLIGNPIPGAFSTTTQKQ